MSARICHVKSECPSYNKTLGNTTNATLSDDESSSNNQIKNSYQDKEGNYMAFTSTVESESLEDIEKSEFLKEESKDEHDIYATFHVLFEECLELKKS